MTAPNQLMPPSPTKQAAAEWMADPTRRHDLRYWDGSRWTEHVSSAGIPGLDPVAAVPGRRAPSYRDDSGFTHFLRFVVMYLVMVVLCYVLIGFVWLAFALAATGRRKRDVLMMFIPVWSLILLIQTVWRYTAKNVYWSVRPDSVSRSLWSSR